MFKKKKKKCLTWTSIPFYPCFFTLSSLKIILFNVKAAEDLSSSALFFFFYFHMPLSHIRRESLPCSLCVAKLDQDFVIMRNKSLGFYGIQVIRWSGIQECLNPTLPGTFLWGNTHTQTHTHTCMSADNDQRKGEKSQQNEMHFIESSKRLSLKAV